MQDDIKPQNIKMWTKYTHRRQVGRDRVGKKCLSHQ